MGIVTILRNWSNKLSGNHKEKRALRFESLEQRHLLSVSPLELPYYMEDATAYVSTELDVYANQEVVFEPIAPMAAPEFTVGNVADLVSAINDYSGDATDIVVKLSASLTFESGETSIFNATLTDGVTLDLNGHSLIVPSGATVNITGVTFTSELDYVTNGTDNNSLTILSNAGKLVLTDCTFEDITAEHTGKNSSGSVQNELYIVSNSGDLTLDRVLIHDNFINAINPNNGSGSTATANFYGVFSTSNDCTLTNVMIYGNDGEATTQKGGSEPANVFAISSNAVMNLHNCTILQTINNTDNGGFSYVYNTLYTEKIGGRVWVSDNNLIATEAELAEIFAYYNNGTFLNAGVKDYSLNPDSELVIDQGNSSNTNGAAYDIFGNTRISGASVDIGAVELFQAVPKTECDPLTGVDVAPAAGLDGLTTLVLTWDAMDDADGYEVRYFRGDAVDEPTEWSDIATLDADVLLFELDDLQQGETVYFEVRSISDSLAASEWVRISTATNTRLAALGEFNATATSVDTITLTWEANGFQGDVVTCPTNFGQTKARVESCVGLDWVF